MHGQRIQDGLNARVKYTEDNDLNQSIKKELILLLGRSIVSL